MLGTTESDLYQRRKQVESAESRHVHPPGDSGGGQERGPGTSARAIHAGVAGNGFVDLALGPSYDTTPSLQVRLGLHGRLLARDRDGLDCPTTHRCMIAQFDRPFSGEEREWA